ncbi:MAG: TRAP transporter large permease subunit [Alphaproteobacteria bacterium]
MSRNREAAWLKVLDQCAEIVLVLALLGELAAVLASVFARTFFSTAYLWAGEVSSVALSILTFIGGAVAYRRRHHAALAFVLNALPERTRHGFLASADMLVLLSAIVTAQTSLSFIQANWGELTPILRFPTASTAIPLLVSMLLLAVYAAEYLWCEHGRHALVPALLLIPAAVLALATRSMWLAWFTSDTAAVLTFVFLLVSVILGLPVGFVLLLAAAAYLWISGSVPMIALPQNMITGTSNFVLLAIPFFILAGFIMERGGISLRLVRFVQALVGHFRGGLLQVMVVSMYLVSGLSGSKAADIAAIGTVMRDMLKRERYDENESTAVLAASAAMGETVPPSIAMLILGSITKLSMAALFIAGLVPAAVIALCLMALIYIRARTATVLRSPRATASTMVKTGIGALLPLMMPLLLLVGIASGAATPTEVSSLAVVYGLILAVALYREMGLRSFLRTTVDAAVMTGMVLFILAAASALSWVLTVAEVPQRLVDLLHTVRGSESIFLVGTIVLLIVVGAVLEGLPALNVLGPLLLPIAGQIGVNELHYGIVLIIAMGIGAFLPPIGVGFYVCCSVMRTNIERSASAMVPYLICLIIGLLIVTFIPGITLFLPRSLGFKGY